MDGDVLLQPHQRHLCRESHGCSPRSCATSGASRDWWSLTGARCRRPRRRARRGLDLRDALHRQASDAERSSTRWRAESSLRPSARPRRRARTRPGRARAPGAGIARRPDLDAHHALAREAAAGSRRAAQERRQPPAPRPGARAGRWRSSASSRARRVTRAPVRSQVNPTRVENALEALRADLGDERDVAVRRRASGSRPSGRSGIVRRGCGRAADAECRLVFLGLPPPFRVRGLRSGAHGPARLAARSARAGRRRQ